MSSSDQFFKGARFDPLKDVLQTQMHSLYSHLTDSERRPLQSRLNALVVNHLLIPSLICVGELHHAYHATCTEEAVKELFLHPFLTVDWLWFQVCVPVKYSVSKWADELLYEVVVIGACPITCQDEMSCLGFPFPSNCKNLGVYYPVDIQRLSTFFMYDLEYISESQEEPSYYSLIVLVIISLSYWIDKDATKAESCIDCSFLQEWILDSPLSPYKVHLHLTF